ncbi:unnamed protein product [Arctogadus glacialis]
MPERGVRESPEEEEEEEEAEEEEEQEEDEEKEEEEEQQEEEEEEQQEEEEEQEEAAAGREGPLAVAPGPPCPHNTAERNHQPPFRGPQGPACWKALLWGPDHHTNNKTSRNPEPPPHHQTPPWGPSADQSRLLSCYWPRLGRSQMKTLTALDGNPPPPPFPPSLVSAPGSPSVINDL